MSHRVLNGQSGGMGERVHGKREMLVGWGYAGGATVLFMEKI